MKVTVFRDSHKVAIHKSSHGGVLQAHRIPIKPSEVQKSTYDTVPARMCRTGVVCVLSLFLGFLLSQTMVLYCSHRTEEFEVQVDLPANNIRSSFFNDQSWPNLWRSTKSESSIQNSILMAVMLKTVHQNILDEIQNEGFILVDSDSPEFYNTIPLISEEATEMKMLPQFGDKFSNQDNEAFQMMVPFQSFPSVLFSDRLEDPNKAFDTADLRADISDDPIALDSDFSDWSMPLRAVFVDADAENSEKPSQNAFSKEVAVPQDESDSRKSFDMEISDLSNVLKQFFISGLGNDGVQENAKDMPTKDVKISVKSDADLQRNELVDSKINLDAQSAETTTSNSQNLDYDFIKKYFDVPDFVSIKDMSEENMDED